MGIINPPLPVPGPRGTEETNASSAIIALLAAFNGNIDNANIAAAAAIASGKLADADKLGLTDGGTIRRGKSIIATSEARANVAYGLMPTPDRVSGIVLPTDGLIAVAYRALWQESVLGAARAAIFLGANQLVVSSPGGVPLVQAAAMAGGTNPNLDMPLASCNTGLGSGGGGTTSTSADVTTGQAIGSNFAPQGAVGAGGTGLLAGASWGWCLIFAAAGTYDVSVQFKASSGSVTAKSRSLEVLTVGF